jgi:hypothetical protein
MWIDIPRHTKNKKSIKSITYAYCASGVVNEDGWLALPHTPSKKRKTQTTG